MDFVRYKTSAFQKTLLQKWKDKPKNGRKYLQNTYMYPGYLKNSYMPMIRQNINNLIQEDI